MTAGVFEGRRSGLLDLGGADGENEGGRRERVMQVAM
jgi:hypothetical protein